MKGKKFLILSSIFAGVALIGSTFAAWAVTDNADPFGLKISPGTISADTDTKYVTLTYGDRSYADISSIESGKTYLGAKVQVVADTSNSAGYTGKFNVSLINQTEKGSGEKLLINYLSVDVYSLETGDTAISKNQGAALVASDLSGVTKKNTSAITSTADVEIECADATPKQLYVAVTLQANLDASTLQAIHDDVVYLQMNWNRSGAQGELTASKIYFKYSASGKDVYCFAWGENKVNAEYPGALMTADSVQAGLYEYNLNTEYEKLLFVVKEHNGTAEIAKTGDLTISTAQRQTSPCFTYSGTGDAKGSWTVKPETLAAGWYLVGTFNSWTPSATYKLTQDSTATTNYYIEGIQLEAGAKIKVRDADGVNWRGAHHTYDGCGYASVDEEGNAVVGSAGVYKIWFYSTSEDYNYIKLAQ